MHCDGSIVHGANFEIRKPVQFSIPTIFTDLSFDPIEIKDLMTPADLPNQSHISPIQRWNSSPFALDW